MTIEPGDRVLRRSRPYRVVVTGGDHALISSLSYADRGDRFFVPIDELSKPC